MLFTYKKAQWEILQFKLRLGATAAPKDEPEIKWNKN